MQFETPVLFVLGLLASATLIWLVRRLERSRRASLEAFASPHLVEKLTASVSSRKRHLKAALLVVGVAALFAALARPQLGHRWEETHQRGIDILMAVDTSKSMLATDVAPNRLERAKLGILDFVSHLEGDRVGLIPFSGTAFLMTPLTLDYDAFRASLEALDTTLMPKGGTDLAAAIREAEAAFDKDANHRILVLITDGEDLEGEALAAAEAAAGRGITIHSVGVGTPAGELIPSAGGGFLKDEEGQMVQSRLDEGALQAIAAATGGSYEPLGPRAEGLQAIYQEKLSLVPQEEFAQRMRKVPLERFEWPLLLALICLSLEFVLGDRKPERRARKAFVMTAGRRWRRRGESAASASMIALAFLAYSGEAQASPQNAEKAYEEGAFEATAEQYSEAQSQSPEDRRLAYNQGAAAYRAGDFAGAASAFETATADQDLSLQGKAYYNRGNALYREGQLAEAIEPQQTITQWQAALTSYEGALAIDPEDADAQFNHDLVKRRLEELQEEQPPQECENPNMPQNSDEDSEEDSENDQKSSGGGSSPEPQGDEPDDSESEEGSEENTDSSQGEGEEEESPSRSNTSSSGDQETGNGTEQDPPVGDREGSENEESAEARPQEGQESEDQGGETSTPATPTRRPGQMTPEQAEDLLEALEGEEGEIPFIPASKGQPGRSSDDPKRDW